MREDDRDAQVIRLAPRRRRRVRARRSESLERRVASGLAFLRRRLTGDYEVDEFGYDPEFNATVLMPLLAPSTSTGSASRRSGIDNIPRGRRPHRRQPLRDASPLDALMLPVARARHTPRDRHLRLLGADLVYQIPVLGHLARKAGTPSPASPTRRGCSPRASWSACSPRASRASASRSASATSCSASAAAVSSARRCARASRSSPARSSAPRRSTPRSPTCKPLARLLGLPYFPVTPTFPLLGPPGLVPLPSKWMIQFGEPMTLEEYDAGHRRRPDDGLQHHRPRPRERSSTCSSTPSSAVAPPSSDPSQGIRQGHAAVGGAERRGDRQDDVEHGVDAGAVFGEPERLVAEG